MTINNLIKQAETKIQETQSLINNYEKNLTDHKNILQTLINKLQEIKQNMKSKNNKKSTLNREINTK